MTRVLAIAFVALAASSARADDRAAAKKLYDEGLRHYNIAEYTDAIAAWKQAYLLSKKPILLFNLGQAYRLSGDCAQAQTFYDSYARELPNPPNQDELDQARASCKDRPQPAVVTSHDPPPDTNPRPVIPPVVEVPPKTPPPIEPRVEPSHTSHHTALIVGAVGVVFEATALYFALDSVAQSKKLDGYLGEWTPAQHDIEARGKRDVVLGYTLGGLGAAALIASGVIYVLDRHADDHPIVLAPLPGGAAVAWSSSF